MELIIAILWFVSLLTPNTSYNYTDIDRIAGQNQQLVSHIASDATLSQHAQQHWTNTAEQAGVDVAEEWEDPIPDPIIK